MSNSAIFVHNSCKKLAQLHKVVEYLTGRLTEIEYQMEQLHSDFDGEFQTVFKKHEVGFKAACGSIDINQVDVAKTISELFIDKHKEMNYKFRKKKDKLIQKVQTEENSIMNEISIFKSAIFIIQEGIEQQINTLQRPDLGVSHLKLKVKELEKKHKQEIAKYDAEFRTKLKDLENESKQRQDEIAQHYAKLKTETETNDVVKTKPAQKSNLKESLKERLMIVRQVEHAKRELVHQQTITNQNFNAFRARLQAIIDENAQIVGEQNAEVSNMQKQLTEIEKQHAQEVKALRQEAKNEDNGFENTKIQLKNGQKLAKSQFQERMNQLQKKANRVGESSFDDLEKEYKLEEDDLKKKIAEIQEDLARKKQEDCFEIESLNQEFDGALYTLCSQKEELISENKNTVKQYEMHSKEEKETEITNHKETMRRMKAQKQDMKLKQRELEDLQSELEKIKSITLEDLDELPIGDDDIDELRLSNSNIENEKQEACSKAIRELESELRQAEEQKRIELDGIYQKEIERIGSDFRSETRVSNFLHDYEKQLSELNAQLRAIEISAGDTEDQGILDELNQLDVHKIRLIEDIRKERESIRNQRDAEYKELEQALPKEIDPSSIHIDTRAKETMLKHFIPIREELDAEITKHNKELTELRSKDVSAKVEDDPRLLQLRQVYEQMRIVVKERYAREENKTSEVMNKMKSLIETAKSSIMDAKDTEEKKYENDHEHFRQAFKKESTHRQNMRQLFADREKSVKDNHNHLLVDKRESFMKKVKEIGDSIQEHKQSSKTDIVSTIAKRNSAQIQLLQDNIDRQIRPLRMQRDKVKQDSEQEITNRKKQRDDAKIRLQTRPMRPEEKRVLDRLEFQLKETTADLTSIGKEYLEYREGLLIRDDEFNQRFGRPPMVGIAKRPATKAMSMSLRKRPLPPLASGFI